MAAVLARALGRFGSQDGPVRVWSRVRRCGTPLCELGPRAGRAGPGRLICALLAALPDPYHVPAARRPHHPEQSRAEQRRCIRVLTAPSLTGSNHRTAQRAVQLDLFFPSRQAGPLVFLSFLWPGSHGLQLSVPDLNCPGTQASQ